MNFSKISEKLFRIYRDSRALATNYRNNILWMNLYQGLNILTSILVSVAFARLSSQNLYGQYIFVISIVSFLSLITMPGIRTTIFRSVSKGNDSFYLDATKFSVRWSLLGIPSLILLGLYFFHIKSPVVGASIMIASIFFPLVYSLQSWKNLLKAKEKFGSFFLYESSISISKALIIIGLLITGSKNLLLIMVAYFTIIAFFNSYYFLKSLKYISRDGSKIKWKRDSYEYTLLNFTSHSFKRIDRILIGLFLPFSQVAIYNIAIKVSDTLFKFTKSSIEAVLPGFFNEEYGFSKFYAVFLLLFLVPITLFPFVEYPILFLYTEKYSESVFLAQVYLFAVPFYFLAYVSTQALIKESLNKEAYTARILSIIFFIISSIILIPNLGILGGVIASLVYYPIQILSSMYYLRQNQLI